MMGAQIRFLPYFIKIAKNNRGRDREKNQQIRTALI